MFNTNIPTTNNPNSNENPYLREVFTPRPGIHYVVAPKSDYSSSNPEMKCPHDSTPTYIKSQEEWNDWKFILGMKRKIIDKFLYSTLVGMLIFYSFFM